MSDLSTFYHEHTDKSDSTIESKRGCRFLMTGVLYKSRYHLYRLYIFNTLSLASTSINYNPKVDRIKRQ